MLEKSEELHIERCMYGEYSNPLWTCSFSHFSSNKSPSSPFSFIQSFFLSSFVLFIFHIFQTLWAKRRE